jgi:hypothetical protein
MYIYMSIKPFPVYQNYHLFPYLMYNPDLILKFNLFKELFPFTSVMLMCLSIRRQFNGILLISSTETWS